MSKKITNLILAAAFFVFAILGAASATALSNSDVVLNLTFDDASQPWKDYSGSSALVTPNGPIKQVTGVCHKGGCADMSAADGSDYLQTAMSTPLTNGMTMSFWVYLNDKSTVTPHAYYQIGPESSVKWSEDSVYGLSTRWFTANGEVGGKVGSEFVPTPLEWVHYVVSYNNNQFRVWQNGILIQNASQPRGTIKLSGTETFTIGKGLYNINIRGLMDDFIVYKSGSITPQEVEQLYRADAPINTVTEGSDLYVKAIKYELPRNWNNGNTLIDGNLPINVVIGNAGSSASGTFKYSIELEGKQICTGDQNVPAQSTITVTCNWPTQKGYFEGNVRLDTANSVQESVETNNVQRLIIPFVDHPYMQFNLSEWKNQLKPFCSDPTNTIAYSACDRYKNFLSEDFNSQWTGNDVDPRAKKGRENAMTCLYNDYNMANEACKRAKNHLLGWTAISPASFTNVQSIHELAQVGFIYDIMFPTLTQQEAASVSSKMHAICQATFNLKNVRPDKDPAIIKGDNGQGFSDGLATFCYSVIGDYKENPTLIHENDLSYWGANIPEQWMRREQSYLMAYKNDGWSKYQERWLYKFYSQAHLVENIIFEKKYDIGNVSSFNNAYCAMGRELITEMLDHSYNGKTLRNDENRVWRGVQAGDSNSYEDVGSDTPLGWGIADYYGAMCDDVQTKQALLYLRQEAAKTPDGIGTLPEMYIYRQFSAGVTPVSPDKIFPRVIFDNANDILSIRTNYSYRNDTIIQIDGGEERGMGHSQAQGYYLYALGEPFLDYTQVPYEDDTRAETWNNGISLQNAAQTAAGLSGTYSERCGNAPLNQYYGMMDCPAVKVSDYPDFRSFPLNYGGDVEDYMGTADGNLAGAFVWRPYKNAQPVKEYFIKVGDMLAKRTVVSGVTQGQGIFHNFINVRNEFTEQRSGTSLTYSRNGKNLDIQVMRTNQPLTLGGGDSPVSLCFAKTSCTGTTQGNSNYRRTYLTTSANNLDLVLSHSWYMDGKKVAVSAINAPDSGMKQGNNAVLFDTDNNGVITYGTYSTNGWGLVVGDTIAAFNATSLSNGGKAIFSASSPVSASIKPSAGSLALTINTMSRGIGIDQSKQIDVTLDASALGTGTYVVKKNGQTISSTTVGSAVTFKASSGQNSDTYVITNGGGIIPVPPTTNTTNSTPPSNTTNTTVPAVNNTNTTVPGGNTTVPSVNTTVPPVNTTVPNSTVPTVNTTNTEPLPLVKTYNGNTTNFTKTGSSAVSPLVLDVSGKGRITFDGTVNVSGVDLDTAVEIRSTSVSVDTGIAPMLDRSATVTLYNVALTKPRIVRDGTVCTECTIVSYNGKVIMFRVPHFTTYTVEETPVRNNGKKSRSTGWGLSAYTQTASPTTATATVNTSTATRPVTNSSSTNVATSITTSSAPVFSEPTPTPSVTESPATSMVALGMIASITVAAAMVGNGYL